MTLTEQIISILIAAVVTMATRFIPFLIFDQSNLTWKNWGNSFRQQSWEY